MFVLQSRWKIQEKKIVYYGLQNRDHIFHNEVKLKSKEIALINSLPKELDGQESKILSSVESEV